MSTKINVRSPYYLDITEPVKPVVEFTCTVANLLSLSIDQAGIITMPKLDFGDIISYTSTDSGFANGKYATVNANTSRTVSFNISIPDGFSNSNGRFITCTASAVQPKLVCTGGVTANGSIPSQTINANGNSVTINLASYFTPAGGTTIAGYNITNPFPDFIQSSISGNTLTLTSLAEGGTKVINIEAFDSNVLSCDATQNISITVNNLPAFDCTTANLIGGTIAQNGTITDPLSRGTIASKSLTSGGSHITSVAANTGSSAANITLFFDIEVPTGYSNAAATVICSKTFTQQAPATFPAFTCDTAGLTGQAIYTSGAVLKGSAAIGTIESFTPISFAISTSVVERTITYKVRVPSSGYSNNDALIDCVKTMDQPAIDPPVCGINRWNYDTHWRSYNTIADVIDKASTGGSKLSATSQWISTTTTDQSSMVGTSICYRDAVADWGNHFIPVRQNYVGTLMNANYITVLEINGFTIIGVWEYNNNFYTSGYKTATKLY
tara:strand:+ start:2417 stop:3907 length:1491 start_codon:yes stop_codon:yes gene_type:complete